MLQHWLLREPTLSLGVPVYVCAAILFPLHLAWTGASLSAFAAYLLCAAILFAAGDTLLHRGLYYSWGAAVSQSILTLFALAVPATLAFAVGSLAGPVDEAFDQQVCASIGVDDLDTAEAEADDTFDVTPDCAG